SQLQAILACAGNIREEIARMTISKRTLQKQGWGAGQCLLDLFRCEPGIIPVDLRSFDDGRRVAIIMKYDRDWLAFQVVDPNHAHVVIHGSAGGSADDMVAHKHATSLVPMR